MADYWGYHLILDASGCELESISDGDVIKEFVEELVVAIDMVPFGEPQIVHFGKGNKKGYTLVQLIETSNICAHFVEEQSHFYLDVFSCKPFEPTTVLDVAQKYFKFTDCNTAFLERQAPLPKDDGETNG